MTDHTINPDETRSLRQLRRLSLPIMILLTVALALLVLFTVLAVVGVLSAFQGGGDWRAFVSFSASGLNLSVVRAADTAPGVALDTLDLGRRAIVALLAFVCAACGGVALFHLRQLFALYTRGVVFAADNIRHIKRFGLWLALAAIVTNAAAHIFAPPGAQPVQDMSNAALAVVFGLMAWAVARAMELGRAADLERRGFV